MHIPKLKFLSSIASDVLLCSSTARRFSHPCPGVASSISCDAGSDRSPDGNANEYPTGAWRRVWPFASDISASCFSIAPDVVWVSWDWDWGGVSALASGNMLEDREEFPEEESFEWCMTESPSLSVNDQYLLVMEIFWLHTSHACRVILDWVDYLCFEIPSIEVGKLWNVMWTFRSSWREGNSFNYNCHHWHSSHTSLMRQSSRWRQPLLTNRRRVFQPSCQTKPMRAIYRRAKNRDNHIPRARKVLLRMTVFSSLISLRRDMAGSLRNIVC